MLECHSQIIIDADRLRFAISMMYEIYMRLFLPLQATLHHF